MSFSALEKKIQANAQKYYTDGSQELSDKEFDKLVDKLKEENPASPMLKTGWGYDVNSDTTYGHKVKHKYGEVGSLDKVHNWKELKSSLRNSEVVTSLKLDGLSVVMYYESGQFKSAVTRGDGVTGIDITDKIGIVLHRTTLNDTTFSGGVRGEIVMSNEQFRRYKSQHEDAKNARNTAAGIINSKELSEDLNFLSVVVYKVVGGNRAFDSYSSMLSWLHSNFTDVVDCDVTKLFEDTLDSRMVEYKDAWYDEYPADGIVIASQTLKLQEANNEYIYDFDSQAFKFPAESKLTRVKSVDWSLSKTKYMIPVINVEPVQLSGTTVQFATGFNAKYIKDHNIGPGAEIELCKANEIIPYVLNVVSPSSGMSIPTHCPCCDAELIQAGVNLMCPNYKCTNYQKTDLLIWCNLLSPVDGIGDVLREKFLYEVFGDLTTVDSLMSRSVEDLDIEFSMYNGSGKQFDLFKHSVYMLFNQSVDIVTALQALNIPRLGLETSRKLSEYPDVIERVLKVSLGEVPVSKVSNLDSFIGYANANSILSHLDKFARLKYIWDRISWTEATADRVKVAITGKLAVKRSEFESELNQHGFELGSLSKDTAYLITDDPNSGSSKNIQADKYGVSKITEQDFRNKFMR